MYDTFSRRSTKRVSEEDTVILQVQDVKPAAEDLDRVAGKLPTAWEADFKTPMTRSVATCHVARPLKGLRNVENSPDFACCA
jgi:hypothetical protein